MQNSLSEAGKKQVDELQAEYAKIIVEYGDRHFKIKREQIALEKIEAQLKELDQKYFAILENEKLKEEAKDVNN